MPGPPPSYPSAWAPWQRGGHPPHPNGQPTPARAVSTVTAGAEGRALGAAGEQGRRPHPSLEWCRKMTRTVGGMSFKRLKCSSVTRRFCQACG